VNVQGFFQKKYVEALIILGEVVRCEARGWVENGKSNSYTRKKTRLQKKKKPSIC